MKIGLGEHAERFTASVSPRIQRAFSLFADGMYYSTDLNCTVWEFAVTIKDLRDAGLSDDDMRWLMRKHYVEHAVEVTQAGDESRSFRPSSGCILSDRACFVWTEKARALVFADPVSLNGEHNARNGRSEVTNGHCTQVVAAPTTANLILVPTWDRDRQELRWGDFVIKQFKVPSPTRRRSWRRSRKSIGPRGSTTRCRLSPIKNRSAGCTTQSKRSTATRRTR